MDFIVNEATFSLPCRSFIIDYSVSQKRKLAVVKEFTIRLLYSIREISPDQIAEYFGFSTEEMQVMLVALQEERLIKWEDGNVKLTSYANERFEQVDGKSVPRFFEVTDQIDTVTFDLFTFKLLIGTPSGSISPNNMEILLPSEAMGHLTEKAKSAFDKNFYIFLEKVKKVNIYSETTELYKINQVFNRFDSLVPIKIQYVVNSTSPTQPTIQYADKWMDEWDDDKSLYAAVSAQKEFVPTPRCDLSIAFGDYIRISRDPSSTRFFRGENFDFAAAMDTYSQNNGIYDLDTKMLIGNLYTPKNKDVIQSLIDNKFGENNVLSTNGAVWCIDPEDKIWGRGPELEIFMRSIESRFDERRKPERIILVSQVDCRQSAFIMKECYSITGANFQGVNKMPGNSQCEILLIPNVMVACIFHFIIEDYYPLTLPIGYVSTNEDRIEHVRQALTKFFSNRALTNSYFERKGIKEEEFILNSKLLKVLD